MGRRAFLSVCAVALSFVCACHGRIIKLSVSDDARFVYSVETFGFVEGGTLQLAVGGVRARVPKGADKSAGVNAAFVLRRVSSPENAVAVVENTAATLGCVFDAAVLTSDDTVFNMSDVSLWRSQQFEVTVRRPGLYALFFSVCQPVHTAFWYTLRAAFFNPGPDYLSAGERALPELYSVSALLFAAFAVVWLVQLRSASKIHSVHHLMTVVLLLKTLALLFEAISYHFLRQKGHTDGWTVVFYVFAFAKGTMLFVVILLIGTGWSLLKPFLADREKKILMVVLPLQVVDNVAFVVLVYMAPGSMAFTTWSNVLHVVDLLCCFAVLLPVVWSLHHLKRAAAAGAGGDGKSAETLAKFRKYYLAVVAYLYFTRFVAYVVNAVLPFMFAWVGNAATEAASVMFYVWVGYKFRPTAREGYLRVDAHDEEEAGGGVGGVELQVASSLPDAKAEGRLTRRSD